MLSTEKGFSLWEMLVCILFLSLMCLVTLRFKGYKAPDHYYFLNEYMLAQSEAIKEKEVNCSVELNTCLRLQQNKEN